MEAPPTWKEWTVDLPPLDARELLASWRWLVDDGFAIRLVTSLGNLVLEHPSGTIHYLDAGTGAFAPVAKSWAELERTASEHRAQWFSPELVARLREVHGPLAPGQVYGYKIPPSLSGSASDVDNYEPTSLSVHHAILGQIAEQASALPPGTRLDNIVIDYGEAPGGGGHFPDVWPGLRALEENGSYRFDELAIDVHVGAGVAPHMTRYGLRGLGNSLFVAQRELRFTSGTADIRLDLDDDGTTLVISGRDYVGGTPGGEREAELTVWHRIHEGALPAAGLPRPRQSGVPLSAAMHSSRAFCADNLRTPPPYLRVMVSP